MCARKIFFFLLALYLPASKNTTGYPMTCTQAVSYDAPNRVSARAFVIVDTKEL